MEHAVKAQQIVPHHFAIFGIKILATRLAPMTIAMIFNLLLSRNFIVLVDRIN